MRRLVLEQVSGLIGLGDSDRSVSREIGVALNYHGLATGVLTRFRNAFCSSAVSNGQSSCGGGAFSGAYSTRREVKAETQRFNRAR